MLVGEIWDGGMETRFAGEGKMINRGNLITSSSVIGFQVCVPGWCSDGGGSEAG